MRFSHSRVETFKTCPFQFKLRYIDKLETLPNYDDPTNALVLGHAMHTGIETTVEEAVKEYLSFFPVVTDEQINETIKLEAMIPKVKALLSKYRTPKFEMEIGDDGFIGYVDFYDEESRTLLDFKYSNHGEKYSVSPQIHLYKRYLKEKGFEVERMGYLMIPKVQIRQKKTETVQTFRYRLSDELSKVEPSISWVTYDEAKLDSFYATTEEIGKCESYEKNQSRLCDWCDYKEFCIKGDDYMIIPQNIKRNVSSSTKKNVWIYGEPFTGKTTLASKFPNVLMLNTDGNYKYVDSPVLPLVDEKVAEGNLTKVKAFAWETFKKATNELSNKSGNTFETIVVDLVEDLYESCRTYIFNREGIKHESDSGFGKGWDMVKTEFLSEIRRFMNLDYNIVLISHEDSSKDITRKSGDKLTSVKPNINDKVANKLAGMVDIVCRTFVDENKYLISFKTDEVVFGGGRIKIEAKEIKNDYDTFIKNVYGEEKKESYCDWQTNEQEPKEEMKVAEPTAPVEEPKVEEKPIVEEKKEVEQATTPVRRQRKPRN